MELLVYLEADGSILIPWIKTLPFHYEAYLLAHVLRYLWQAGANDPCCAGVYPSYLKFRSYNDYRCKEQQLLLCLSSLQLKQYALFIHHLQEYYLNDIMDSSVFIQRVQHYHVLPPTLTLCNWETCDLKWAAHMLQVYDHQYEKAGPIVKSIFAHHWLRVVLSTPNRAPCVSNSVETIIYSHLKKLVYILYCKATPYLEENQDLWQLDVARQYLDEDQTCIVEQYYRVEPLLAQSVLDDVQYKRNEDCTMPICLLQCTHKLCNIL